MAQVMMGSEVAKDLRRGIAEQIDRLKAQGRRLPRLAVVLVGDNPASLSYVRGKEKACAEVGMASLMIHLPSSTTQAQLMEQIRQLNQDATVDGILCQLPLPEGLDERQVIQEIAVDKDVDGFHPVNVGKLHLKEDGFVPCTPLGCMELLHRMGVDPAGKRAVVIGRSNLVGAPVARLLLNENATVTICHSKTADLPAVCRQADILIAAVGRAKMITSDYIKEGAAVIDVGINRTEEGRLTGDVDFDSIQETASMATPVPGGVGAVTTAVLALHLVQAAARRRG